MKILWWCLSYAFAGVLAWGLFRLFKHLKRRPPCGHLHYLRYPTNERVHAHRTLAGRDSYICTYTVVCLKHQCLDFLKEYEEKSFPREFTPLELWWRKFKRERFI